MSCWELKRVNRDGHVVVSGLAEASELVRVAPLLMDPRDRIPFGCR
jgi:hypothetical protein